MVMKRPDLDIVVVAQSHWQGSTAGALALVPELATTSLTLESWPIGAGGAHWVIPMTGVVNLAGVVLEVLEQPRQPARRPSSASSDEVLSDGLVAQLLSMVVHTGLGASPPHGRVRAQQWPSHRALRGRPVGARAGASVSRAVRHRVGMPESERSVVLGQMFDVVSRGWRPCSLADRTPDGMTRRDEPTLWVLSHEQEKPDVSLVAGLLRSPLDGP